MPRKGTFKPGDRVRVGDRKGTVLEVGTLHTRSLPPSKWVGIKWPDGEVSDVEKDYVEHDYEYLYRGLVKKINHSK